MEKLDSNLTHLDGDMLTRHGWPKYLLTRYSLKTTPYDEDTFLQRCISSSAIPFLKGIDDYLSESLNSSYTTYLYSTEADYGMSTITLTRLLDTLYAKLLVPPKLDFCDLHVNILKECRILWIKWMYAVYTKGKGKITKASLVSHFLASLDVTLDITDTQVISLFYSPYEDIPSLIENVLPSNLTDKDYLLLFILFGYESTVALNYYQKIRYTVLRDNHKDEILTLTTSGLSLKQALAKWEESKVIRIESDHREPKELVTELLVFKPTKLEVAMNRLLTTDEIVSLRESKDSIRAKTLARLSGTAEKEERKVFDPKLMDVYTKFTLNDYEKQKKKMRLFIKLLHPFDDTALQFATHVKFSKETKGFIVSDSTYTLAERRNNVVSCLENNLPINSETYHVVCKIVEKYKVYRVWKQKAETSKTKLFTSYKRYVKRRGWVFLSRKMIEIMAEYINYDLRYNVK